MGTLWAAILLMMQAPVILFTDSPPKRVYENPDLAPVVGGVKRAGDPPPADTKGKAMSRSKSSRPRVIVPPEDAENAAAGEPEEEEE